MAGVKGRSGGPRANSGGPRPGSGRKPGPVPVISDNEELSKALSENDPKVFLLAVMSNKDSDARLRMDAAKALMPFMHVKLGEGGKKNIKEDAAKKAGQGRFAAAAAPLKLVGSK